MIQLAAWCALRFGELVRLRRADVNVTNEVIRVRSAAVRVDHSWQVGEPKSDAGRLDEAIPLHIMPAATANLAKHVGRQPGSLSFPAKAGAAD